MLLIMPARGGLLQWERLYQNLTTPDETTFIEDHRRVILYSCPVFDKNATKHTRRRLDNGTTGSAAIWLDSQQVCPNNFLLSK